MSAPTGPVSERPFRVLHVVPSLSAKDGGPTVAALQTFDGKTASVIATRRNIEMYKISLELAHWLVAHVDEFDLVHVHALFSFSSIAAGLVARKKGIPYIIRPLGVLNRWGVRNRRRIAKRLSYRLLEKRVLLGAAAIHFTSAMEAAEAYEFDPTLRTIPGITLPLPVEAPPATVDRPFIERFPVLADKDPILFLSRLHEKKGVEVLMEAFASIRTELPRSVLILAGDGDSRYVRRLRARAGELGIEDRTIWPGFLSGGEKWDAMRSASVFVLPSFSENFGIAAAEALAAGVPTILSDGVAIAAEAARHNATVLVKPEGEALRSAIMDVLNDAELRRRLAQSGKEFANRLFSPQMVGAKLANEYRRLCRGRA